MRDTDRKKKKKLIIKWCANRFAYFASAIWNAKDGLVNKFKFGFFFIFLIRIMTL